MTWQEVKNSVNEWLWDNISKLYLKILETDEETKMIKVRLRSGFSKEILYEAGRFQRN